MKCHRQTSHHSQHHFLPDDDRRKNEQPNYLGCIRAGTHHTAWTFSASADNLDFVRGEARPSDICPTNCSPRFGLISKMLGRQFLAGSACLVSESVTRTNCNLNRRAWTTFGPDDAGSTTRGVSNTFGKYRRKVIGRALWWLTGDRRLNNLRKCEVRGRLTYGPISRCSNQWRRKNFVGRSNKFRDFCD